MTHYVYELSNEADELLYVGESNNWARRAREHMRDKPWASQIATVTISRYDTQRDAQIEEVRRIRSKRPSYNFVHNNHVASPPCHYKAAPVSEVELLRGRIAALEDANAGLLRLVDEWHHDYLGMQAQRDKALQAAPRVFVCEPTPRVLDPRLLCGASHSSPPSKRRGIWKRTRDAA